LRLRRDMLLFGSLAIVALAGGWWLLSNRPGAAIDAFITDTKTRTAAARPNPANAEAFRATVCAAGPCVLVEAGGLAFVIGAAEGAAQALTARGLMRPDIDAVVLADLTLESIGGLPELARASLVAGRTEPLKVYGPSGIVPVIDGLNLMLSGDRGVRFAVGVEQEDQGLEGVVVFDSGVVSVRAFGGRAVGEGRVYRVDFEGKSLVVAGCAVRSEQIVASARGTQRVAGIAAAGSATLQQDDQRACIPVNEVLAAAAQAKLTAILLAPLQPSSAIPGSLKAWREVVAGKNTGAAAVGGPGSVLDFSGETPAVRPAG
jgi:hypothetical protein